MAQAFYFVRGKCNYSFFGGNCKGKNATKIMRTPCGAGAKTEWKLIISLLAVEYKKIKGVLCKRTPKTSTDEEKPPEKPLIPPLGVAL